MQSEDTKGRKRRVFQTEVTVYAQTWWGGADDEAEEETKVHIISDLVHCVKLCSLNCVVSRRTYNSKWYIRKFMNL